MSYNNDKSREWNEGYAANSHMLCNMAIGKLKKRINRMVLTTTAIAYASMINEDLTKAREQLSAITQNRNHVEEKLKAATEIIILWQKLQAARPPVEVMKKINKLIDYKEN